MADIGSLVADLMVNDAQFNRGLASAAQKTKSFSAKSNRYLAKAQQKWDSITKSVFSFRGAMIAAASATALGYFVKKNLDAADAIGKTADKIGITTGKLQEYRFMANRAGVDTSQLDKGLEAFTKRIGELRVGTGALNTHLNKMDEAFKNELIAAKSTGEALDIFMNRMAGLTNASDKAALSAAAFSRSAGVAMVNVVRGGREEVEKLRKTFKDLGLEIDEDLIRNSERANDSLTNLTTVIKTELMSVVLQVAPAIADVTDKITNWVKENRDLIDQKIPEYLNKIKSGFQKIWDVLTYDPAIVEFGIIGLVFWGKKGAVIMGGLGHMVTWVKNLSAALALASTGAISFKEIVSANFKELEAIVKRFDESAQGALGNFVRMKVPKDDLPTETWTKGSGGGTVIELALDKKQLDEIDASWEQFRVQGEAAWIALRQQPGYFMDDIAVMVGGVETELQGITSALPDWDKETQKLMEYGYAFTELAEDKLAKEIEMILEAKANLTLSDKFMNWTTMLTGAGETFEKHTSESGQEFYTKVTKTSQFAAIAMGQSALQFINAAQAIVNLPSQITNAITDLFNSIGDFGDLMTKAIDAVIDSAFNMVKGIGDIFTKLIPRLITMVPEFILALVQGVPLFIQALSDSIPLIIDAFIKDIPRIVEELVKAIGDMVIPGVLGGKGGKNEEIFGIDIIPDIIPIIGKWFHKGGIVGKTTTPSRALPANVFANAPRLHSGLRPGEVPAIVEEGEEIIPKDGIRRTGTNVNITLHNAGVITTDNVEAWLANTLTRLRKNKIGEEFSMTNMAMAGIDI